MKTTALFFLFGATIVAAQRPFYAGLKPIGYPELADRFQPQDDGSSSTTAATLGNRFGEDGQPISTTTVRLPVDALGDKDLVDRISKWPVDKQPYWYINWKIIEAHRQQRPNLQDPSQAMPQQPTGSQQNVNGQPIGQPLPQSQGSVNSQRIRPQSGGSQFQRQPSNDQLLGTNRGDTQRWRNEQPQWRQDRQWNNGNNNWQ